MKDFSDIVKVIEESSCDSKLRSVHLEQMSNAV
jgi:hypothetical protein